MNEIDDQQAVLNLLQGEENPHPLETARSNNGICTPALSKNDELLDWNDSFDFEGFQVVRREFFAHQNEPAITFNNQKFYVNCACLSKFPQVEYVHVLINQETKILALRPCQEYERNAFLWCGISKGKRKPKQTTCRIFCEKIMSMMGWNPHYRYKLLGKLIHANGEYLIAFDLTATEVYQRTYSEGEKPKTSRTAVFPAEWQHQFGLPFYEHQKSMQISTFDGYAIYAIKDPRSKSTAKPTSSEQVIYEQVQITEV